MELPSPGCVFQEREKQAGINVVFFDENGNELSGRPLLPVLQSWSAKAIKSDDTEFNFAGRNTMVAKPITTAKGNRYFYVANIPRPPFQMSLQTQGTEIAYGVVNWRCVLLRAGKVPNHADTEASL